MPRIYLEKINIEKAKDFKLWTDFTNPYLQGYNYSSLSDFEIQIWYGSVSTPRKKYFSINKIEDDRFIGFIGLKEINPLLKKAKLGIVFDSKYTSMGYGKEALEDLLDHFFRSMKYRELILDVNQFNDRAINLYNSVGFLKYEQKIELFENQDIEFNPKYFTEKGGLIFSKINIMKLTKVRYYELQNART